MFGRRNSNDNTSNNQLGDTNDLAPVNVATPQRPEQNLSVNGYVSPYMTTPQDLNNSLETSTIPAQQQVTEVVVPAQQIEQPSTQISAEDLLQNTQEVPTVSQLSEQAPVVENVVVNNVEYAPVGSSDNLLDDPMQVDQILNEGGANSKYVVNQVVTNATMDQANLGNSPLSAEILQPSERVEETLIPQTAVQQIDTVEQVYSTSQEVNTPKTIEQIEPAPQPEPLPEVNEVTQPQVSELNPEVDLATASVTPEGYIMKQGELHITDYLNIVIEKNASDLHLTVGYPAAIRIDGKLQKIGDQLTADDVRNLLYETLGNNQKELLEVNKEVDLSYQHEDKARFRVNAYNERGNLAAAYRLIPTNIRTIEELALPPVLYDFTRIPQGLFLVTGPTGHGKSTTLAAMLQEINLNYPKHIVTIEDPIEYVYQREKAVVDQRELGQDTHDWNIALRSILRQDPDVVLIGEMRDFETIQAAITIAETGHLVFATLHTNSAAQSIDRIIDVFPPHQQEQVRTQLAGSLKGILSQRLIPTIGGGRKAAIELMVVNPAIQNLIREGKTYQIDNVISTSFDIGMVSIERSLVKMVREGKITVETAQEFAIRPDEILKLMKSGI